MLIYKMILYVMSKKIPNNLIKKIIKDNYQLEMKN